MTLLGLACFLALRADTNELQEMVIDSESGTFCKPTLNIYEVAVFEVHHFLATGTYKVVMVLYRSPNNITAGTAACSYFTNKAEVQKYAKGTVHSGKAYGWIFILSQTEYVFGIQVTPAVDDCFQHSASLWGHLISPAPQNAGYPGFRKLHMTK